MGEAPVGEDPVGEDPVGEDPVADALQVPKRIAIVQSNYIPWKGYFDLIADVDEFVLLDDAQFTRRDWRNRNRIKTADGLKWLTIPVEMKGKYGQAIGETRISDPSWSETHWRSLYHAYSKAPCFSEFAGHIEGVYREASDELLSHINHRFLVAICDILGIDTKITWSTDYGVTGQRSERLLGICGRAGATEYLSGPSARTYLDESLFEEAGIDVIWMGYEGYPEHEQLHPPFEHQVTVLDLIFHTGANARGHMLTGSGL